MLNRHFTLALVMILSLVFSGVALAQTNISDSVTTVPANSEVLDYGMVSLDANSTVINGCTYVYKLDEQVPPDAAATISAPDDYEGEITFTVTGNKFDGYTIMVEDTVSGYTAVIDQVYFGVGNTARKFTFYPGVTYASPLPAPLNKNRSADISHTHFCYDLVEDENGYDFETAFAKNGDSAVPFCEYYNRWGWTNPIEPGTYVMELWAGAGQCNTNNGTLAGHVTVVYDESTGVVTATTELESGFIQTEEHFYAGYTMWPPTGALKIGQYQNYGPFDGTQIYVIYHAVVGIPLP